MAVRPSTPSPFRNLVVRRTSASVPPVSVATRWTNSSVGSSYSKTTPPSSPDSWTARETIVLNTVSRSSVELTARPTSPNAVSCSTDRVKSCVRACSSVTRRTVSIAMTAWLANLSRTRPHLARRARLVLLCGDGLASNVVARKLHVRDQTVSKWRARFVRDRLDGLYDEPRPGAPRTIGDEEVERVLTRTLETTPRGQTHWSVRGMAQATGLSRMTISRIWHAFGLQPHRSETFKLSPDPLLIDKVRDVVGLYMNPPEHAVVLCVDEKEIGR